MNTESLAMKIDESFSRINELLGQQGREIEAAHHAVETAALFGGTYALVFSARDWVEISDRLRYLFSSICHEEGSAGE